MLLLLLPLLLLLLALLALVALVLPLGCWSFDKPDVVCSLLAEVEIVVVASLLEEEESVFLFGRGREQDARREKVGLYRTHMMNNYDMIQYVRPK